MHMELKHNPQSFITGDDPFIPMDFVGRSGQRVDQEFTFDTRHEGFIGIPHGGLAMGLCLDAWRGLGSPKYPVDVNFKFGGTGVSIGDSVWFSVERANDEDDCPVTAKIIKKGDKTPYLRAEISSSTGLRQAELPEPPPSEFRSLPYYRNCFVCGHHRTIPGLKRRFRSHSCDGQITITSRWGSDPDDFDRAQLFLIGKEELHPAVLTSIFDENTAWGGFMETRSCGLSVRVSMTVKRPVARDEPLLFLGRAAGTRGNPRNPRFFFADGQILSMADPQNPEPILQGRGEWLIMHQYTEQIKENLLPADDWQWIFGESEGK